MNWLDYFLILVIGLSTLLAAMRGFVGEVISLVGWVVAFTVASRLSGQVEPYLANQISNPTLLGVAAFVLLFVAVLVGMGLVGYLLKLVVGGAGLTALDRSLGMLFGFARGALLVMVGFMILLAVDDTPPSLVRQSSLSPHFMNGAQFLGRSLPEGSALLGRIRTNYDHFQNKAGELEKGMQQPLGQALTREIQKTFTQDNKEPDKPPATAPKQDAKELDALFRKYNSNP